MNKNKLFKSIYFNTFLAIFYLYMFLSIVRSVIFLILIYTNNWNINDNLKVEEINKIQIYILVIPILLVLTLSYYFKKLLNLKKRFYIPTLFISILIFRFLDTKIRQPFLFTDSPRFNIIFHLFIFSFLFFGIYFMKNNNISK